MIRFLDTSALVKLYLEETGSQGLAERLQGKTLAVSHLTYGETYATFARRLREDLLDLDEHQALCETFAENWSGFLQVPFSDAVLANVPSLCQRYPLRGADALQLASALMLRDEELDVFFVASDRQLLTAARGERLSTLDPESL